MKVGICAIIKDCFTPYLFEWFNYHHSIGVDHFFIYDNGSEIPIWEIVKQLPFTDNIHIETIAGTTKQLPVYDRCLDSIKKSLLPHCDRVAFIDDDEFIVCENNDIKATLSEYEEFSGLGISWRMFGSSGIKERTLINQREKFTQRTTIDYSPNQHIKSIVNPFKTIGHANNPHSFNYSDGYCVNVNKEPVDSAFTKPIWNKIWIDHYFTRSLEEWKEKAARGRSDTGTTRSFSEFYEVDANCSGRKPNAIHLVMPFYRQGNKEKLIDAYRPMNVILHPIMFYDELHEWDKTSTSRDEAWVQPFVVAGNSDDCEVERIECFKRNKFIKGCAINDDDYYVCVDDDDMYESNVFNEIRKMDDDIIIISMKRGYQIPKGILPERRYPTSTLIAHSDNIAITKISGQQSFVKGKIFKQHLFDEEYQAWDGLMAIHYKESGEQIVYRPDLFVLFNYYESERWTKSKVAFGVMVNDPQRLDMVFGRSHLEGQAYLVKEPESATKGLNYLLDTMEKEGAEIGVLCHQDMHFRSGWVEQMLSQIKLLPESWTVASPIGKDMQGRVCGRFRDMRIPDMFDTSNIHNFPHEASCFDECVIIVNLKKKFRFDEGLNDFHLYGTLAVLQANEVGGTAWIINACCEHYIMRSFRWEPNENFKKNYKWLYDKFPGALRVDSTAIGTVIISENKNKESNGVS